jgi:hypothetical protein
MDDAHFLLCTSQDKADQLQQALLDLSYAQDDPNRPAKWFSEWHKDGEESVRVCVKGSDRFWMRVGAPADAFDDLLQPYIDAGQMPQSDLDQIHMRIRVLEGTGLNVPIFNMMPPIIRQLAWSYQDMVDNGWISED